MQQNHSLLWYGSIKRTRTSCPRTCRGKRPMWGSVITVAKAVVFYTHLLFHLYFFTRSVEDWISWDFCCCLWGLHDWILSGWPHLLSLLKEFTASQCLQSGSLSVTSAEEMLPFSQEFSNSARTNLVSRQNTNKSVLTGMDSEGSPSQNEVWWCRAVVFLYCVSEQLLVLHIQYIYIDIYFYFRSVYKGRNGAFFLKQERRVSMIWLLSCSLMTCSHLPSIAIFLVVIHFCK